MMLNGISVGGLYKIFKNIDKQLYFRGGFFLRQCFIMNKVIFWKQIRERIIFGENYGLDAIIDNGLCFVYFGDDSIFFDMFFGIQSISGWVRMLVEFCWGEGRREEGLGTGSSLFINEDSQREENEGFFLVFWVCFLLVVVLGWDQIVMSEILFLNKYFSVRVVCKFCCFQRNFLGGFVFRVVIVLNYIRFFLWELFRQSVIRF